LKKALIGALVAVAGIGVATMLGFIPAIIGAPAMIGVVAIKDVIFLVLARGTPLQMMSIRVSGGLLWGVMDKSGNITTTIERTKAGMVFPKGCGGYNVMTDGMTRLNGVPFYLAPEEIGYNVKWEHLQLIKELRERGIDNILEVIDTNEQGQFIGWKDDPRIRDLKEKYTTLPQPINLPGLNDFHRYAIEAAHPYRQEANIKMGVAQVASAPKPSSGWMWIAAIAVVGAFAVLILFMLLGGGGGGGAASGGKTIPAMLAATKAF